MFQLRDQIKPFLILILTCCPCEQLTEYRSDNKTLEYEILDRLDRIWLLTVIMIILTLGVLLYFFIFTGYICYEYQSRFVEPTQFLGSGSCTNKSGQKKSAFEPDALSISSETKTYAIKVV